MSEPSITDSNPQDTGENRNHPPGAPSFQQRLPAQSWQNLRANWQSLLSDQVAPVRLASHVALLLIAGLVLLLSRVDLPQWDVADVISRPAAPAASNFKQPALAFNQEPVGGSALQETGVLLRAPVPFTEIPDRPRLEVITYTVQVEDTVQGIAEKFKLHPDTIMWANHDLGENPFLLAVGQELRILPLDGVYHKIKDGDTIESIAKKYRITPEKIVNYEPNGLSSAEDALEAGSMLIVPDGEIYTPPPALQGPVAPWRARDFVWPTSGRLTQLFWPPHHPAIDIGAPLGADVRAVDDGKILAAGWSTVGYGNYVIIRHDDGFQTLYAHLSQIDVSAGERVERGQRIGLIGSTGRSTGPHLHFEVRRNGQTYNPLLYLP